MKKILIYLLVLLCILILIPSIFTKKRKSIATIQEPQETKENLTKEESQPSIQPYEYAKYAVLRLYHPKTNQISEIPIDEYLYGVVSAEMPASYELEALKAQAIVARTYTLYQIINSQGKHTDADICDDSTCCQAWISKEDRFAKWDENLQESNWNKITQAVDSTQGQIITYNHAPIDAFFHSNSGGKTETAKNVWGGTNFPYLQSVETSGEDTYSQYTSQLELTLQELTEKIKQKHPDFTINLQDEKPIEILETTESGRIRTIRFGNTNLAGTEARTLLGLKSTNFSFEINQDKVKFTVIGYGHGVGMSQTGADSLAKSGSGYEEIIKHFYTGVEITYVNEL